MKKDTEDFLATLLLMADDPDREPRKFYGKTVYDFSDAFIAGAESFVDAFRTHLEKPASAWTTWTSWSAASAATYSSR